MDTNNALSVTKGNNNFITPVADISEALARYNAFAEFVSKILKKDQDYGEIPGTNKPTLLKPGAEKLITFFGIRPVFVIQESVNDWTGADHGGEPFFFREYKCQGYRNGELVGEGIGSCNSWEKKFRYRWMNEAEIPVTVDKSKLEFIDGKISEFAFAVEKAETTGKYGKPAEYWKQFRDAILNKTAVSVKRKTKKGEDMDAWEIGGKLYAVPNHDPADQVNTIDKMAQKRSLVAMVLITTNASDYFTQDMEDFVQGEFKDVPDISTPANHSTGKANGVNHTTREYKPIDPGEFENVSTEKGEPYSSLKLSDLSVRWNSLSKKQKNNPGDFTVEDNRKLAAAKFYIDQLNTRAAESIQDLPVEGSGG